MKIRITYIISILLFSTTQHLSIADTLDNKNTNEKDTKSLASSTEEFSKMRLSTEEYKSSQTSQTTITTTETPPNSTPTGSTKSNIVQSGTYGTIPWEINSEGTLILYGGEMPSYVGNLSMSYWKTWSSLFTKIEIKNPIIVSNKGKYIFKDLSKVVSIEGTSNLQGITSCEEMFSGMSSLSNVDVSNLSVANATNLQGMFNGCKSITNLDVSKWDVGKVTNFSNLFNGCQKLISINVSNWNITNAQILSGIFVNCISLANLDVSRWDTKNVTDMYAVFGSCSSIQNIDISKWDTKNVNTIGSMFYGCSNLKSVDVSNWDVKNVTVAESAFYQCSVLERIDVSKWNTSNFVNINNIFSGCINLNELDVSNWNVRNVVKMQSVFRSCSSLESLDVSNWYTENVNQMPYMFLDMKKLIRLDLSNFNMNKCDWTDGMLGGTINLKELLLGINVKFPNSPALPNISKTKEYTGYWRNIAAGTVEYPQGNIVKASEELTSTFNGLHMSDTYVWQRNTIPKVNVHDSTIYIGDDWNAEDNFDSALDKDGNAVDFSKLTIDDSKKDTSKPGTFEVTYSYDGVTSTAKITVKNHNASIMPNKPKVTTPPTQATSSKEKVPKTSPKSKVASESLPKTGEKTGWILLESGFFIMFLLIEYLLTKTKRNNK